MRELNRIIIHHSGKEYGNANKIRYENIESGLRTIGCHYVINNGRVYNTDDYESNIKDGEVEKGRPVKMANGSSKGHNIDSISICLIGKDKFSESQYESLIQLIKDLCLEYDISVDEVYGYNELNKDSKSPNFSVKKLIEKNFGKAN